MTPSQLAEIRAANAKCIPYATSEHHRRSLLALVDSQSAEIARLRKALSPFDPVLIGMLHTAASEAAPVYRGVILRAAAALTEIAK